MAAQQTLRLLMTGRMVTSLSNLIVGCLKWKLSARVSDHLTSIRSKTIVPRPHSCDLK